MLELKQGEAKTVTLPITDDNLAAVDLSGASLMLGIKLNKQQSGYSFYKDDAAFDKTRANEGIVSVNVTAADTNIAPGVYFGEIRVIWPGPPQIIERTADFKIKINRSVIPAS